jgi:DNA-binding NtrC family response regulator
VADRLGHPRRTLGASALARLSRHAWPGNVRELRNVLERAAVLAAGPEIAEADLQLGSPGEESVAIAPELDVPFAEAKRRTVEHFERQYLSEALREHEGNVSRTATAIGMVRQSLQQKIRELGLKVDEFRRRARE